MFFTTFYNNPHLVPYKLLFQIRIIEKAFVTSHLWNSPVIIKTKTDFSKQGLACIINHVVIVKIQHCCLLFNDVLKGFVS